MQVRELLRDDDAVSPVIGVILMVAITVILAAVIASFVLGLGGSQQTTPQASFSWDFTEVEDSSTGDNVVNGYAEVSHDGGDSIRHDELIFRGSGFDGDIIDSGDGNISAKSGNINWPANGSSGSTGDTSAVVGGDSLNIGATSDFEFSLVWEPEEGDTSATLSEQTGPDA
ncbi:type IV pilin [Halorientalis regularis]|uniref:Flagellin N-terminal-like domain-containing protein n=1 Tax=Halorientalis regularis TaxID=660518 RepID=A0A1G7PFB7_9EURY|nr:type IV pilin N-terminal domain-containing protein [Halorientalis regularis]SDF85032.1 flagellin N-terminal-like domain-containing protein [Halorientalis regularis]